MRGPSPAAGPKLEKRPRGSASRASVGLAAFSLIAALGTLPACYAPQIVRLQGGLDSLRAVVDTITVRDSVTAIMVADARREIAEQRDILLSTRATTGTTTQELFDQMGRLEGKLEEVLARFQQVSQRASTPMSAPSGDPNQIYDQAAQDLAQGRYALALQGFRDFLRRNPSVELSDNAQYGVGECFFAQSQFDSALVEYQRAVTAFPQGDKAPASLYKLGLTQEKLGRPSAAKSTFEDLIRRFPESGEAQLARERTGTSKRR